jgi:large subunit ribosomal protein L5
VLEISVVSLAFDGRGNYNLGVLSKLFSEIDIDKVNKISGMDISFNWQNR